MATTVSAIYEDGVLRLLAPLSLPEHTAVDVTVDVARGATDEDSSGRVRRALVAAGLSRPQSVSWNGPPPLTTAERTALAQLVAACRPLSEIITEEREGR